MMPKCGCKFEFTMSNTETCKKPPDGGYGWVITFAYALNNVFVLPLITNFGLVLQGATSENALSRTQVTFVIILNHSIGMLLSLFGGPVLSRYGYRKVAIIGAIFISSSLMLTFFAHQFWQFLLWYSILCSMGISAIMAAFTLAINSFFDKNRGKAIGISMSITGLGTILMPKLMSSLINAYGWRYTVLTLGAICLHSLLAACLLRPAKWYLKEEEKPILKDGEPELTNGSALSSTSTGSPSLPQLQASIENGKLPSKSMSLRPLISNSTAETRNAISHPDISSKSQDTPLSESRYKWWGSLEINLNSSINIFEETTGTQKVEPEKKKKKGYLAKLVEFFDLTLLSDPIFVNIIFGISLAGSVETNFSVLLPIILNDMLKLDITDQSTIMSVIGLTDTLFRFVSPFIGEWCNKSPRVMYIASLFMIIFTRTMMLFTTSFTGMLFVSLALGITKALRTLCVNLVMPNYIPIHRLAFASGIQMFFNGIAIFIVTFFLTRIREASGSYILPIIMLNIVTLITIISWGAEFIYYRLKNETNNEPQTSPN